MDLNSLVTPVSKNLTFPLDCLPSPRDAALARQAVQELQSSIINIRLTIKREEDKLVELKALHEATVASLEDQRRELEAKISKAQAYLAPIRKLPDELLGEVFLIIWLAGDKKCGWQLAAVNRLWRRVALSLPKLWSSIQLKTTTTACPAETIRLWLERSGRTIPIEIDITLTRPPGSNPIIEKPSGSARRRLLQAAHHQLPSIWSAVGSSQFGHGHHSLSPPHAYSASCPSKADDESNSAAIAWGYIVFDYLVKQLERWKRFRFLFSTPFPSLKALDEIRGRAPLLEEFTVGITDGSYYPPGAEQWHWLPSTDPRSASSAKLTPNLKTLELRNVPFKYSSPLLSGLTTLKLVSNNLSVQPMALNRVLAMLSASPGLKALELNVATANHILPLSPVTLEHLQELKVGGHTNQAALLQQFIGQLITPSLTTLSIEVECRTDTTTMGDCINNLLLRSPGAVVKSFSYGSAGVSSSSGPYSSYHACFPTTVLSNLYHLEELITSACPMEPILQALASPQGQQDLDHPDDETDFGGGLPPPPQPINSLFLGTFGGAGGPTVMAGGGGAAAVSAALSNAMAAAGPGPTTIANINAAAAAFMNSAGVTNVAGAIGNPFPIGGAGLVPMVTPPLPGGQFNDDYLCPYLRKLTFKNCSPSPDGVTKLIKVVEARNPDQIGIGGGSTYDGGMPRRLRKLELIECGHVGNDVIEWLEERVENVLYTEGTTGPPYRTTPSFTYNF